MSYVASFSGGKDSCLACYKAMLGGCKISHLVNFISKEHKRVTFHGTEAKLIQLQAQAIGIPLLQKETTRDGYEREFKQAIRTLIPSGMKGIVFGDIYLQENKKWVETICSQLSIEAVEPLWGKNPVHILSEFINAGFKAVIVSAQSPDSPFRMKDKTAEQYVGQEWVGRFVDADFVRYLEYRNIDICGENGEYHTLVVDGPIFKKRIKITESRTISRNGHCFLDTRKYCLVDGAFERA